MTIPGKSHGLIGCVTCLQVRQLIESRYTVSVHLHLPLSSRFSYYFQARLDWVNAALLVLGEISGIIALLFEM